VTPERFTALSLWLPYLSDQHRASAIPDAQTVVVDESLWRRIM
jgi:hypothetical protein